MQSPIARAFRSIPVGSPTLVRYPFMNYAPSTRSLSLSPKHRFQSITSVSHGNLENVERLIEDNERKNAMVKEKEVEAEFWKGKYEEIIADNKKSQENVDAQLDLLDEYRKKIEVLLEENAKLNGICEERMQEIEFLRAKTTSSTEFLQEMHELHSENVRLNKENMSLRSEILQKSGKEERPFDPKPGSNEASEKGKPGNNEAEFWREKCEKLEAEKTGYIEDLRKTLEVNIETASKTMKNQISGANEGLRLRVSELESEKKILANENSEAKAIIQTFNEKYESLLRKIEDYQRNYVEKEVFERERTEGLLKTQKMEGGMTQLLLENEKLLSVFNEKSLEVENWRKRYENLERNHTEHIKQLKRTWEASHLNSLELTVKERTMVLKQEIEGLEIERENLLRYIREIEEKQKDSLEKLTGMAQRCESQKKRLTQLEAEKERVEVYQAKIREIEEQHFLELKGLREKIAYERESELVAQLQERVEILSEELRKMNIALDEKTEEIFGWSEKFRTYEDFHSMKMRDLHQKLEIQSAQIRSESSAYVEDMERKLEFMQEEKLRCIEEVEKWRGRSLELEGKLNNIGHLENKLEILGSQNLALNKSLNTQMQENLYWKEKLMEQERLNQYLFELEGRIRYLMAENDRLNKIIIMRCKDMMGN